MTAAHSKIGASSADRWMTCPGSVKLSANLPNYTTEYAAEGTAAHQLAEQCYTSGMQPETFIGTKILVEDKAANKTFTIEVTQEMCDAVHVYLGTIDLVVRDGAAVGGVARAEVRFHLKSIHKDLFGTGDFVHFNPSTKTLTVLDYKHGAGKAVEVKNNSQLKYYALGALLELKVGASKVVYGIVQPRCPHPDGPVRTETIDALDLLDFADELVRAAKATEDPAAPLVPGDHCRWCPAAAICPALRAKANAFAAKAFAPTGPGYDKAQLVKDLAEVDLVEARCKSVREFAYSEAERGEDLPGWKLVAKRATRKWLDAVAARTYFLSKGFSKTDIETTPELKSPPQIEKLVEPDIKIAAKAITDKAKKKEFVDAAWADFNSFVKAESSGHTLVADDDPRPAVKPAVTAVFQPQ